MKLQPASLKEIRRIAKGTLILDVVLVCGLFLLSNFGIGTFALVKILLSAAGGTVVAVANFALLCITVQQAVEIEDRKKMQAKFQLSYNARMIAQSVWAVVCFLTPGLHFIAGAAPLLFPKLIILYLNAKGKLVPKTEPQPEPPKEA